MIINERTLKARGVYDIQRKDTLALQDVQDFGPANLRARCLVSNIIQG